MQDNQIITRCCPNPFSTERVDGTVPVGGSVADIIKTFAPRGLEYDARVYVDDIRVEPDEWESTYPRGGQMVTARVLPSGDNSGILRTILGVGVLAASFWLGGATAGLLFTKGTWGYRAISALTTAGASCGGVAAVNAIVPYPMPKLSSVTADPPNYAITGYSNQINQYGVIPRVYGTHRIFPPLAAQPYTENMGNDSYFRMLFCAGYGPLNLSSFKIGETDAENYDIEIEYLHGDEESQTLDLFPNIVSESSANIHITDSYAQLTTEDDSDEATLDITFPYGLTAINDSGGKYDTTVELWAQYRESGSADPWLPTTDPTEENLASSLDEWTLEGDASYAGGEIEFGNGSGYGKATSPLMFVNFTPGMTFNAEYYGYGSVPRYAMNAYYYRMFGDSDDSQASTNYNGDSFEHARSGTLSVGSWADEEESFTGGDRVRWVQIVIHNNDSSGTYKHFKMKGPELTRSPSFSITGSTTSAVRRSIRWIFDSRGQYDVRVKRTDPESTSTSRYDKAYLSALRSIQNENPVEMEDLCLIAVRVRATDQLNGILDQFNCVATSLLPAWNGASWDAAAETSNPAWAYVDVLKGGGNQNALADARLDLSTLKDWADYCTTAGFEFNGVIDREMTVYETLQAIAPVGRATPTLIDGDYSVVIDKTRSSTIQLFSDRNIKHFFGNKVFYEVPHALKIRFLNEDEGYREDERVVYQDDYDADNATIIESIEMWGVTDPDLIWKHGRYRLACMLLQPETFHLETDLEHLVCTKGDWVKVISDVPMWGMYYGRIKSYSQDGGNTILTLDQEVEWPDTSLLYGIYIRNDTYGIVRYGVDATYDSGDAHDVYVYALGTAFDNGDLVAIGHYGSEVTDCLVKEIQIDHNLDATLTLVEYNADIYDADSGTIPDFDSKITVPPDVDKKPPKPIIRAARSDESVLVRDTDGSLRSRILIDIDLTPNAEIEATEIQVFYRKTDSEQKWISLPIMSASTREISIMPVEDGESYDIKIWSISYYGKTSDFAYISNYPVVGKSTVPPDVSTLYYDLPGLLRWSYPSPPRDLAGFEIRFNYGNNSSWAEGTKIHDDIISATYFDIGDFSGGTMTFMVKAVDTSSNYSDDAAVLIKDIGGAWTENIIDTTDYHNDGFPGIILNGSVNGGTGDLEANDNGDLFWKDDEQLFWADDSDTFWQTFYLGMSYIFDITPASADVPSTMWLDYTITGLRDIMYRLNTTVETDDFNTSPLSGDWTDNASGATWDINGNKCRCQGGSQDDLLTWKTGVPDGDIAYIKMDVTQVNDTGAMICGTRARWNNSTSKYQWIVDWVATDTEFQPSGYASDWVFVVNADGSIDWYAGGFFLGSNTREADDDDISFYNGEPANTGFWDDFELRLPVDEWRTFAGTIDADDVLHEFRVRTNSSETQGAITELDLNLDVPDIIEYFDDVSIIAGGTRLTLTETYRGIANVQITVQDDGISTAVGAYAFDKNHTTGPLIYCVDKDGTHVAGTIDAKVKGY